MAKKQHWLYKEYDLDGWFHKHFLFKHDTEFIIFMAWALFLIVFVYSLV